MHDVVILYSGGSDSRMLLEMAKEFKLEPYCLLIDYEQLHKLELKFARNHLDENNIPFQIVKIKGLEINSGLTGTGTKDTTGEVHEMHVPGRNTMFLSIAYSIAESREIDTIWLGNDWDDRLNLFPDCSQEYIVAMNEAFKIAGPKPIKIEAPLMGISKENSKIYLAERGITETDMFSGYGDL